MLIITSAMILVLLGILALSIDMGYVLTGRTQLQNGVDAAARAAAAGLHAAIESGAGYSQQDNAIIKPLAIKYAGLNSVRRYPSVKTEDTEHYPEGLKEDPNNAIKLDGGDIEIKHDLQPPRVIIRHRLDQDPNTAPAGETPAGYDTRRQRGRIPTIFAGIFGVDAIGVGAGAIGTVIPVEGGAGLISGGWRPLLLPDTYFDAAGQVWAYGERVSHPLPDQAGDYYRSRFAGSTHSGLYFVDGSGSEVTSIRDAKFSNELRSHGGNNLLAQPITIKRGDWRVVDFRTSYPTTVMPNVTPGLQIANGYGGYVRVGNDVTVYTTGAAEYDSVKSKLQEYLSDYAADNFDGTALSTYGYVTSSQYQTANTHPQIIPVLLCDPLDLARDPGNKKQYQVTNFGAFFLTSVNANGDLTGYFVREVLVGGLTLQSDVTDSKLLPVTVQVLR